MYETWIENYLKHRRKVYGKLAPGKEAHFMISEENWMERASALTSEEFGISIRPGDICWIDYGQAYVNEIGFQHFGLIIKICYQKALVIPMTSNEAALKNAYDSRKNPLGNKCLMEIGKPEGMHKNSTLFLNDMKFINSARVIYKTAYLDPESDLFKEVMRRVEEMINGNHVI